MTKIETRIGPTLPFEQPLVSIFTPTYRTGSRFVRAHRSVLAQTYPNWEWIIWDDSDDGGKTHEMLGVGAATFICRSAAIIGCYWWRTTWN